MLHAGRTLLQVQQDAARAVEVNVEHGVRLAGGRGQPVHHRPARWHGVEARGMAGEGGEEVRVGPVEALEQAEGRGLRHQQVVVVGKILGAVRGDADAHGEACGDEIEEDRRLIGLEREVPCIGGDQRFGGLVDILHVEQRIGQRHRKLVDLAAMRHVAEVDEAGDGGRGLVDHDVVVVRILVQHRAAQQGELRQHALFVAREDAGDEVAPLRHDVGEPGLHRHGLVEVPQEAGAEGGRVA